MSERLFLNDLSRIWPQPNIEVIPPRQNFNAWRENPLPVLSHLSQIEAIKLVLVFAGHAPSAHNKQPQLVNFDKNTGLLQASVDSVVIGTPSDRNGRQAHIGLGCFAENLSLALVGYGLEPRMKVKKNTETSFPVLEFDMNDIQSGQLTQPDIFTLIKARRSYRGPFIIDEKLPEVVGKKMKYIARSEGLELTIHENFPQKVKIGFQIVAALDFVLALPAFRRELGDHLVPNDTTETRVMPGNTFGLQDSDAQAVHEALLSDKPFPGHFAAGLTQNAKELANTCSAIVTISASEDTAENWIKTGMLLEQLWLYAQSQGFGVNVNAGLIEAEARFRKVFQKILKTKKLPTAMFFIGRPRIDYWPHSPRATITLTG